MYLIFDTETTGLPRNYQAPLDDFDNWPRVVQLAWQLHDAKGLRIGMGNYIIRPDGFTIPFNSEKVHGISTERALKEGLPLADVLAAFEEHIRQTHFIIGHNLDFDVNILGSEYLRMQRENPLPNKLPIDTKVESTDFCKIPGSAGRYKWPTLDELHRTLFERGFQNAHDAMVDVRATSRCFLELVRRSVISITFPEPDNPQEPASTLIDPTHYLSEVEEDDRPVVPDSPAAPEEDATPQQAATSAPATPAPHSTESPAPSPTAPKSPAPSPTQHPTDGSGFVHLHLHSQFSVLKSPSSIKDIIKTAKEDGASAVALTDLGNMFGTFSFVKAAHDSGLKPIIGCEIYLVEDRTRQKFTRDFKDHRTLQVFLAKDMEGYRNLSKIVSKGFIEGYYHKYPRVDKQVIAEHSKGLITLTGGLYGEIPDLILNRGEEVAEQAFVWWKEQFGDDFYISLQRHGLEEEERVNQVLLRFAKKYGVKVVATNDVYYIREDDWFAHDALLCIDDGVPISKPIGQGRDFRYGFPNHEFYYKSGRQMAALFQDLPQAIATVGEIVDKIEPITLEQPILLPNFALPEGFADEDAYLEHLAMEGAKKRYGQLSEPVKQRIQYELGIIKGMGFAGYFLIVQDFISEAKKMGVLVGPGRGSAAGSVVAYTIGITNVDPLAYELLFERFLNPERVSMPDIDIDFDDEGRQSVIDYVIGKYGKNQVAQIITFGTMAARLSVRDVARVLELPLSDADRLAKKIPEGPNVTLESAYDEVPELKQILNSDTLAGSTLKLAKTLEGSVRNTGIHPAGVIIAPKDLMGLIPVINSKDTDLMVTQYDGSVIENAGMLKMDLLGLKTLSILKTVIGMVKKNHGIAVDLDEIPLDDPKTFELYQKGSTVGTFQFESDGMRKHLKTLKPTEIDDLIAMNALYRPGPMQFIPDYIRRKHGQEDVQHPHPDLEEILQPTYGIMIYQEQIMLVAQKMADFSLGEADILRRIMGKKKPELLPPEEEKFTQRALAKGYDPKVAKEVFDKMALFAGYGFNKSHAAAYSILAYQTMYFKANYPAEYMAAVLSHNMSDLKKVSYFIEECRKMGIAVDSPNINTGQAGFAVTEDRIQFGLTAIKGVGAGVVDAIVQERDASGEFTSIFDFASRVDSRLCNKRALESLIQAGAFDLLNDHRAQLLAGLEEIMSFAQRKQEELRRNQTSLFSGEGGGLAGLSEPRLRDVDRWSSREQLKRERETIGFYLSGHPLERFQDDIAVFTNTSLTEEFFMDAKDRAPASLLGIVTSIRRLTDSKKRPIAFLQMEDLHGTVEVSVFSETYDRFGGLLVEDTILLVEGVVRTDRGAPQIMANSFERAENLREKFQAKLKLTLALETERLQNGDLDRMATLFSTYKGSTSVELLVHTRETDRPFTMHARKYVIDPTNELIKELRDLLGDEHVQLQRSAGGGD